MNRLFISAPVQNACLPMLDMIPAIQGYFDGLFTERPPNILDVMPMTPHSQLSRRSLDAFDCFPFGVVTSYVCVSTLLNIHRRSIECSCFRCTVICTWEDDDDQWTTDRVMSAGWTHRQLCLMMIRWQFYFFIHQSLTVRMLHPLSQRIIDTDDTVKWVTTFNTLRLALSSHWGFTCKWLDTQSLSDSVTCGSLFCIKCNSSCVSVK